MTTVMLINDSVDYLETIESLLREEGYAIHKTTDFATAVEEVRHIQPDLIMLDLLFQREMRGWRILETLKITPETTSIPIILCTVAEEAIRGMTEHLASKNVLVLFKPFDIDDLITLLKKALFLTNSPASSDSPLAPPA